MLREAIAVAPGLGEAHAYLGAALGRQGRLREALAHHREAAMLSPTSSKAVECYMAALMEVGHVAEGFRWLTRALHLDPNSISARQLAAFALLARGYLAEGWAGLRLPAGVLRVSRAVSRRGHHPRTAADLAGRHVWLLQEQGLGDEIFFLTYLLRC